MPTVHMYMKGHGKVVDMVNKPSQFQDMVDQVDNWLDASQSDKDEMLFEQVMADGSDLVDEIMVQMKEKEEYEMAKANANEATKEKSWFTFPFQF
jgi:hypothetical protein